MATTSHRGIGVRGGLHLQRPHIWLDGRPRDAVAWLARVGPPVRRPSSVLCAAPLAALIGSARSPMALPYGKTVALGAAAVTLWPAGSGPGSSLLSVVHGGVRTVIATAARSSPLAGGEPMHATTCDVLVVDASRAAAIGGLDDVLDAALERLIASAAEPPALVIVPDRALAWHVAHRAGRLAPTHLAGDWQRWRGQASRPPTVGPARAMVQIVGPRRALADATAPRLWIGGSPPPQASTPRDTWLDVDACARGEELDAVIRAHRPREVVCWGPGAAVLAARVSSARVVELVEGPQLSLL